jgi:glycosyltransferase involved in cell wall biosynthesis
VPQAVKPRMSVIIPTWNRARLLEQSLRSLSVQSLPRSDFEVILVDDGSTDETPEVCRRWAAELPLRYFRMRHAGNAAAKNLGIFTAAAPLLFFFDDDDVAHEDLLREHWQCHQQHTAEMVVVLGQTIWHPALRVTEVMRYLTHIGQFLFSYRSLRDGQALDFRYFWAGRSSCKRLFLARHGIFCQEFDHSPEDIELGYRLSRFGLRVIYHPRALQYMNRPVTFEEFCQRCHKQGRALVWFARRHKAAEIQNYCEIAGAEERWREGEPLLAEKVRRVGELETLLASGSDPKEREALLKELHELYGWTFRMNKVRGIHEGIEAQDRAAKEDPQGGDGRRGCAKSAGGARVRDPRLEDATPSG